MASRAANEESVQPLSTLAVLCGRVGERLLVEMPGGEIAEAQTTMALTRDELAQALEQRRRAVVLHCGHEYVVTGLLEPLPGAEEADAGDEEDAELVLGSTKGVVLRCGEASVRLTPDGRVLVRGKDVVTRAERRNHVVGATVRLN